MKTIDSGIPTVPCQDLNSSEYRHFLSNPRPGRAFSNSSHVKLH
jgi:hypothetical protein